MREHEGFFFLKGEVEELCNVFRELEVERGLWEGGAFEMNLNQQIQEELGWMPTKWKGHWKAGKSVSLPVLISIHWEQQPVAQHWDTASLLSGKRWDD